MDFLTLGVESGSVNNICPSIDQRATNVEETWFSGLGCPSESDCTIPIVADPVDNPEQG